MVYTFEMYQTIVLGLGFLLFIGGAYLIQQTDKEGVLSSAITPTSSVVEGATSTVQSNFDGIYVCDSDTGCLSPSTLVIEEEGYARMTTSYDNGVEVITESGTWIDKKEGRMTIYITGTDATTYPSPRVLSIKYASPTSLSGIIFDQSMYKEWTRPVFRKQLNDIE